ncbi:MAG: hypothetical protein V1772_07310 [Chloroflexota bacterium]
MKGRTCLTQVIILLMVVAALAFTIRRFAAPTPAAQVSEGVRGSLWGALRDGVARLAAEPDQATPARAAVQAVASPGPATVGERLTVDIDGLAFQVSRPLMFPLPPARGLAVGDRFLYVATFDPATRVGFVYQVDRHRYTIVQQRALNEDGGTLVGGLHLGERWLWAPVAAEGSQRSVIVGLDPMNLEPRQRFAVADRIAAVAEGADGRLYGCNATTDAFYEWTPEGQERRRVALAPSARYTDLEVVRGSLVCAGVDEAGQSVLDVVDAATLSLLVRHASPSRSAQGSAITRGGFGYADGAFLFLPEGGEHAKLYTFALGSEVSLEAFIPHAGP